MRAKFYAQILLIIAVSFFVSSGRALAQAETHDFITYDTVYNIGYGNLVYQMRITRPKNMFTAGNADTASRPAIITMPGQGEMGTNPAKLQNYGPHYWLKNGWDGGVVLGNGTHYPILITILSSTTWPSPQANCQVLTYLLNTYHIKRNSVHLGGLSQGSFTWTGMICFEKTAGDETGMKLVTSLTALEGFAIVQDAPYSTWSRWDRAWGVWAKKYNGKFFGLEGTQDYRGVAEAEKSMNDSVKGSAHFSYENAGGGAHCCWNSMYDPNQHNWQSFPPYGPLVAAGTDSNSRGTYKIGSSIFQWMLRQGDTSMVGSSAPTPPTPQPPTSSAGGAQSITLPASQVSLSGSGTDPSGGTMSYVWSQVSGPSSNITTTGAANTTVTGMTVAGVYVYQLLVTSSSGLSATSTVQITVAAAAPTVPTPPTGPTSTTGSFVKQVVVAEYKTWYIRNDSTIWSYNAGSAYPVQSLLGGRKVVSGAGAFNYFRMLDDQGYVWSSKTDLTLNTVRMDTDTTGAPFSGNIFVDAYAHIAITIRADSSVWYFGRDEMSFFYPGGSMQNFSGTTMRPAQLSPAGMKFKKVLFGGNKIVGLTTAGDVYVWYDKGSKTPTKMTLPRPAIDIFVSHLDVAGAIVPDATGSQTMGYPYIWGSTSSMWGGTGNYPSPTAIRTLWNLTAPIKEITASWNCIHFIDSLGRMYGSGFNSMGEVGNGQEFVNKYTYSGFPGYGWTFTDYENASGVPVQIGIGVTWKHLYSNNWFGFYKYAQDVNDSIYSWGRNKALVLGNGFYNMQEQYSYDAMDVLKPTMVHPLTTRYQTYNFTAPTISAGPKQIITTATATLTGVATAPILYKNTAVAANGVDKVGYSIVSYKWTKVSGTGGIITSPTAATTTVTGLSAGTYIFNLQTVDNNTGTLSANDTIIVTSTAPGTPIADAGQAQVITLPTNSVTLTGTGTESNGTIVGYAWVQLSGPSTATAFGSAGLASTTANGLVQGVYRFQLTVKDALGVTATATVQVTVNPAPIVPGPPSANAGNDTVIVLPTNSVTLRGSGSETNGTIVSYAWVQLSGPSTATTFGSAGQAQTTVNALVQGVYTFQLTVKDNSGVTATDVVKVTVNPAIPVPGSPVANAGQPQTITLPTNSATLTGSGSELNGTIVGYAWTQLSGPSTATITPAGQAQTVVGSLIAGIYRFELTVKDANGVTATATVQVTVNPAAVVPGTPSANAGGDQSITLPVNTATLTGNGSETNGTIVSYAWVQVSGPSTATTFGSAGLASTTVNALVAGVYTFRLTVKDNSGVTATDITTVTVKPAVVNQPPVADPGTSQTSTVGATVSLDGSGSYDPDGTITKYAWTQVSGSGGVTITNSGTVNPTIYGMQSGVYVYKLTVTDNDGASASAQVSVTVSPASTGNQPPVANAGSDTTIYFPLSSAGLLDGRASYDPDGTIAAYSWTQLSGPAVTQIDNDKISVTAVEQLEVGVYVFQLTVTDNQGVQATSTVKVTVLTTLRHTAVTQLFPNPAPQNTPLHVQGINDYLGKVRYIVYDIAGRAVKQIETDKQSFEFQQTIPLSGLGRGTYVLSIYFTGSTKPEVHKFVID